METYGHTRRRCDTPFVTKPFADRDLQPLAATNALAQLFARIVGVNIAHRRENHD